MRLQGRQLRAGMAGDDIAALHEDLDRLGYVIPQSERGDQIFGVGTAAAVAQFQRAHGLWDTAVVDPHTAGMLDRAIEEASLPTVSVPVVDGSPAGGRAAPPAADREPARPAPGEEPTLLPVQEPTRAPTEEPTLVPAVGANGGHRPGRTATPAEPGRSTEPERTPPFQVAVCGPADCTDAERGYAYRVGQLLARDGAVVLCGGGAGVMAAVAAGTRSNGGLVLGILPGTDRDGASADLSAAVLTDLGEARNAVIVASADAVIVIGGSWGTLSELALAKRRGGIPVVSLGGWRVVDADGAPVPGIDHVDTPEAAVARALAARR